MPSVALTLRADREINLCDVLAVDVPCLTGPGDDEAVNWWLYTNQAIWFIDIQACCIDADAVFMIERLRKYKYI